MPTAPLFVAPPDMVRISTKELLDLSGLSRSTLWERQVNDPKFYACGIQAGASKRITLWNVDALVAAGYVRRAARPPLADRDTIARAVREAIQTDPEFRRQLALELGRALIQTAQEAPCPASPATSMRPSSSRSASPASSLA